MVSWILKKIMGSQNQRAVKRLWPLVYRVNEVEAEYQKLSDEELRGKTAEFRKRLADGATLDDHPAGSVRRGKERVPPSLRQGMARARPALQMGHGAV